MKPRHISLIGVPTDIGASTRGAGMGPAALRVAQIGARLAGLGNDVLDCGDVNGPVNPFTQAVEGYRHLAEVTAWNQATHDASYSQLEAGRMPLVMGGDHSIAIGSISAVARHCRRTGRKLKVLWLDAHADCNTARSTPTGNMHGMPVACLCGHGPAELARMSGTQPALNATDFCQIGIRCVDAWEQVFLRDEGVQAYDMRRIDEFGMRHVMELALEGLDADTHLHVSFDVDFLDPLIAPGVGTTVRGGPGYREAQLCMEMIADSGLMGSLDVVELNPAFDERNTTAELAVDLIGSLFGKSTLLRPRKPRAGSSSRYSRAHPLVLETD